MSTENINAVLRKDLRQFAKRLEEYKFKRAYMSVELVWALVHRLTSHINNGLGNELLSTNEDPVLLAEIIRNWRDDQYGQQYLNRYISLLEYTAEQLAEQTAPKGA